MNRCIVVLGGSFDPVHNGHIALVRHFAHLLRPDEVRIIPTGQPWQKTKELTPANHRLAMLRLAFAESGLVVSIDDQEIRRTGPTYTIDTLRQLRTELGSDASLVFLMGADQLQQLHTWKDWQTLFDLAHICAATRPGYATEQAAMPDRLTQELARRTGSLQQIRTQSSGLAFLANDLAIDISATALRDTLKRGEKPAAAMSVSVLDYVEKNHLYKA